MLIKEYRIPMPLSVEEYRVAQLYMIQKKSRKESQGEGSGVEILVNEPYSSEESDGSQINGQYTYKIYHIGKHLPSWFRSIIPETAQRVEEEAWNAYPYTKTRYTCPFMEKFYIEIETKYFNDPGIQDNVFNLSSSELKQRSVDFIDIVKDSLPGTNSTEDPTQFVSQKSGRGPLDRDWLKVYTENWKRENKYSESQLKRSPVQYPQGYNQKRVMCAYKLCRIDFRYWGMQSKVEKFINDIALRKTMVTAHQQAWCWQDEWIGLTIDDIRRLESETAQILAAKMGTEVNQLEENQTEPNKENPDYSVFQSSDTKKKSAGENGTIYPTNQCPIQCGVPQTETTTAAATYLKRQSFSTIGSPNADRSSLLMSKVPSLIELLGTEDPALQMTPTKSNTQFELTHNFEDPDEKGYQSDSEGSDQTGDESLFYDALDDYSPQSKISNESHDLSLPKMLIIVMHGGNFLDDLRNSTIDDLRKNDIATFQMKFFKVLNERFHETVANNVSFEPIYLNDCYWNVLQCVKSLRPNGYYGNLKNINLTPLHSVDVNNGNCNDKNLECDIPIAALPLLIYNNQGMYENGFDDNFVSKLKETINKYSKHQVILVTDSVASTVLMNLICLISNHSYQSPKYKTLLADMKHIMRQISHIFCLGSPMALPLYYNISTLNKSSDLNHVKKDKEIHRISYVFKEIFSQTKLHNMFYETDPFAFRMEPLINELFAYISPEIVENFLNEHQNLPHLSFAKNDQIASQNQSSSTTLENTIKSNMILIQNIDLNFPHILSSFYTKPQQNVNLDDELVSAVETSWWTSPSRIDYVLKSYPVNLNASHFPVSILPHIFYAGYWQSRSIVEYIICVAISPYISNALFIKPRQTSKIMLSKKTSLLSSSSLHNRFSVSTLNSKRTSAFLKNYYKQHKQEDVNNKNTFIPNNYANNSESFTKVKTPKSGKPGILSKTLTKDYLNIQPSRSTLRFKPSWTRTKTSLIQSKSISTNHRANDVIVNPDMTQTLIAKFSYGPLDVFTLEGEKVDIYFQRDEIMNTIYKNIWLNKRQHMDNNNKDEKTIKINGNPQSVETIPKSEQDEWTYLASSYTDTHGRIIYDIPNALKLPEGIWKIKMVIRKPIQQTDNEIIPAEGGYKENISYKQQKDDKLNFHSRLTKRSSSIIPVIIPEEDHNIHDPEMESQGDMNARKEYLTLKTLSKNDPINSNHQRSRVSSSKDEGNQKLVNIYNDNNNNYNTTILNDEHFVIFNCAVVAPWTPIIVFSIDGAFTDNISLTGKDPKLKPGAIDLARLYVQERGCLVLYLTARPAYQMNNVMEWLALRHFPRTVLIHFADHGVDETLRKKLAKDEESDNNKQTIGRKLARQSLDDISSQIDDISHDNSIKSSSNVLADKNGQSGFTKLIKSAYSSPLKHSLSSASKSSVRPDDTSLFSQSIVGMKDKANFLAYLVEQVGVHITVAYGSSKDIPIYCALTKPPERIYSLSKLSRKYQGKAVFLSHGYPQHISELRQDYANAIIPKKISLESANVTQWYNHKGSFKGSNSYKRENVYAGVEPQFTAKNFNSLPRTIENPDISNQVQTESFVLNRSEGTKSSNIDNRKLSFGRIFKR